MLNDHPISLLGSNHPAKGQPVCTLIRCLPFLMLLYLTNSSCTSPRHLQYFQDLSDSATITLPAIEAEQRVIQKNDRLLISFGAQDAEAAAIFNRYGGVLTSGSESLGSAGNNLGEVAGFTVDQDGILELPIIGKFRVEGLTMKQARDALTKSTSVYLKNPYIVVKFLDFKVTVLGEVTSPGTYDLPLQKASLFHALGAAGDLSRSAKRFDIQLFRDYNGVRTVTKIDLRSKSTLYHPQRFLLQHNDVIYVQPRKGGLMGENAGVVAGVLSALISAATLIVTINR